MSHMQSKRRKAGSEASSGTKTGRFIHPSSCATRRNQNNEDFFINLDDGWWRISKGGWLIHVHRFGQSGKLDGFEGRFRLIGPQEFQAPAANNTCRCEVPEEVLRKYKFIWSFEKDKQRWLPQYAR